MMESNASVAPAPIQSKSNCPYVYILAYPESMGGQIFYVGMGTGHRINAHEREARKGETHNSYKVGVIRKIWNNGEQVIRKKLAFFDTNEDARLYEIALIFFLDGLTNLTAGGDGQRGPNETTTGDIPLQQFRLLKNPLAKLIRKTEWTCACSEVKVNEESGKEMHTPTKDESTTHTKPQRGQKRLLLGKDAVPNRVV